MFADKAPHLCVWLRRTLDTFGKRPQVRCFIVGGTMSSKATAIRREIKRLHKNGFDLWLAEARWINESTDSTKAKKSKTPDAGEKDKATKHYYFPANYQAWYTATLPIIEQLLPDRYAEFVECYKPRRKSKAQDYSALDYGIDDYLLGLAIMQGEKVLFDGKSTFSAKFKCQLDILGSTLNRLKRSLSNIRGILQAELFDSELEAAKELLSKGHLRAAGTLAGVTLERHFLDVLATHNVTVKKKGPTLGDLNDELKSANIIDVPDWRFIQRLVDIRNLCAHSKEREATNEEVQNLITGADKIIKTVA